MTDTPLIVPALGALYQALGPWVEALLRFTVGAAMIPHGFRMCLGYFKGTGGPVTRPMALVLFLLLAASAYDHAKYDGYFWNKIGLEYPAMWAIGVLYFAIHGGGPISIDRLIGWQF